MNDIIKTNTNTPVASSDDLSKVVYKALQQIEMILDIDFKDVPKDEVTKILSIKKDAATAMINAGLKADENRFRRENKDIIERLFDKIKKESRIVDGQVIHKV